MPVKDALSWVFRFYTMLLRETWFGGQGDVAIAEGVVRAAAGEDVRDSRGVALLSVVLHEAAPLHMIVDLGEVAHVTPAGIIAAGVEVLTRAQQIRLHCWNKHTNTHQQKHTRRSTHIQAYTDTHTYRESGQRT